MDPSSNPQPTGAGSSRQSGVNINAARPSASGPTMQQPGPNGQSSRPPSKKRKQRGHRRRRNRRASFAPAPEEPTIVESPARTPTGAGQPTDTVEEEHRPSMSPTEARRAAFYRLGHLKGRNLSETSLESEALLDHRHQPMMQPRRESRLGSSFRPESYRPEHLGPSHSPTDSRQRPTRPKTGRSISSQAMDEDESDGGDDRTPLLKPSSVQHSNFVRYGTDNARQSPARPTPRRSSVTSGAASRRSQPAVTEYSPETDQVFKRDYDVNNPPSVPGTPKAGPQMPFDEDLFTGIGDISPKSRSPTGSHDAIIDVEGADRTASAHASPLESRSFSPPDLQRRRTVALPVEEDVCFPTGALSDLGEEEFTAQAPTEGYPEERRRRRRRVWPDLSVLEEWSREEKEERSGGIRAKKISEPVLVGGRLRPRYASWKRDEEEAPYRFTYFNEEFQSTIHSQTISELVQPGQTFRDLFIPDPPELEDDSSDDESDHPESGLEAANDMHPGSAIHVENGDSNHNLHLTETLGEPDRRSKSSSTQMLSQEASRPQKEKRYGPRPTFWLDVLCPTDTEMRVLSKAFGIHALTAEDIMMQEAREKVELFRHYYFLNYRTFEQDSNSDKFLEPVNMYVIVFREGLLTFHFSMSPHPANVRRRIRQLRDYLILSSDWISYAIVDDITDVFGPLIQSIEDEVDSIDETILRLHSDDTPTKTSKEDGASTLVEATPTGSDMLRRVGECRKKVMGLYRLLGNKADVIKGFAKRCNEQWEVAPKSEIGLYLGDIQDHIVTMTSNLSHYETLLSRAHSNYLAQINIRMNERQEQTADVLGKLTVLGTIVLPMNIICGMWGMNVKVPGQDVDNLYWFWSITAGLIVFAVLCFYIAKRVYGIV